SRSTRAGGSPAVTTTSCRSPSSDVCSGASSWPGSGPPSGGGGSASRARRAARARPERFHPLLDETVRTEWVVYAKPPTKGPATVLKYLARYTHKTAISNSRLGSLTHGD